MREHQLELADVFRQHGEAFRNRWLGTISAQQQKALRDIGACRTAVLGTEFLFWHTRATWKRQGRYHVKRPISPHQAGPKEAEAQYEHNVARNARVNARAGCCDLKRFAEFHHYQPRTDRPWLLAKRSMGLYRNRKEIPREKKSQLLARRQLSSRMRRKSGVNIGRASHFLETVATSC
jgi:hypothetical protein